MPALTIFLTFILLLSILAAGSWGARLLHRRLALLEDEHRRNALRSIEESHRFEQQIEELSLRIETAERRSSEAIERPLESVNYTQRSQMLRMIRRGDSIEQIASTLGVALSHVRLLAKLAGMNRNTAARKGHAAG